MSAYCSHGKGYTATDTTGWYVASGTAASTAMGFFQINKSQSNGNQIYIYASNEITFGNGKKVSLKKTTQGGSDVTACIQNNPLYTLEGAVYEIHQGSATGAVVETLTTNANGEATGIKTYAVGTKLYAVEKTAPSGYLLNTSPAELTVSSGSNVFHVVDTPTFDPNKLVLAKTGKDSKRIEGAVFKVEFFASNWADSSKLLRTWYFASDNNGYVYFRESHLASGYASDPLYMIDGSVVIPLGCVLITEVKTAVGYLLPQGNDAKVFLFIRQGGTKIAQVGQPAGAYWGNGSADPLNSANPKGIYKIGNDATPAALTAVNDDVYGKPFTLQKTDLSNVPLAGAIFKVDYDSADWLNSEKHEKTWYFKTDANGFFTLDSQHLAAGYTSDALFPANSIPLGIMRVKEIKAPDGFKSIDFTGVWRMKQTESGSASVDSYWAAADGVIPTTSYGDVAYVLDADPQKLYVCNEPLANLELVKTSPDGKVDAISFKIERYEPEGGIGWWNWKAMETDANGKIIIAGLEVGMKLRVTEIVPEGYVCSSQNPQEVTLVSGTNIVNFKNRLIRGSLRIVKVDKGTNIPLQGAGYRVFNAAGEEVASDYTDENGEVVFEDLPYGEYTYQEFAAPEGFALDDAVYHFSIQKDGETVSKLHENNIIPGSIPIFKTAESGHPLHGVTFLLEFSVNGGETWTPVQHRSESDPVQAGYCTSDGLTNGRLTTDADGKAEYTGLCIDTQLGTVMYRLTEISTQEGYNLLSKPAFEGSLPYDGEIDVSITVVNTHEFQMPATGGHGFAATAAAIALAGIAAAVLLYFLRKKKIG